MITSKENQPDFSSHLKFSALPRAFYHGVVLSTYHLAKAIFCSIFTSFGSKQEYFYRAKQDLLIAKGTFYAFRENEEGPKLLEDVAKRISLLDEVNLYLLENKEAGKKQVLDKVVQFLENCESNENEASLNLKKCNLSDIPFFLEHALFQEKLTALNLEENNISILPKHLFALKKLKQLDLKMNPLSSIPLDQNAFWDQLTKLSLTAPLEKGAIRQTFSDSALLSTIVDVIGRRANMPHNKKVPLDERYTLAWEKINEHPTS